MDLVDLDGVVQQEGGTTVEDTTPEIITMPSRFENKQDKGNIDVWWLYDDGGKWLQSDSFDSSP